MEFIFKYNRENTGAICCGIDDKSFEGDIIIPKTYNGLPVVSIGSEAFSYSMITSAHIPNTVRVIDMAAFGYCPKLTHVTFEEGSCLESVESLAFSGCPSFTHIRLPDNLKVIEPLAFKTGTCEIPDRCLTMSPNFDHCSVIYYEPDLPPLAPIEVDERGNKFRLNESGDGYIVVLIYEENGVIRVPESFNGKPVVELGRLAFSENERAHKAVIPSTVKSSQYFPFYACDEMFYAVYGGTVSEWKNMNIYTWFNVVCNDGEIKKW